MSLIGFLIVRRGLSGSTNAGNPGTTGSITTTFALALGGDLISGLLTIALAMACAGDFATFLGAAAPLFLAQAFGRNFGSIAFDLGI